MTEPSPPPEGQPPERRPPERAASLAVVYFGVGFTLSATVTIVLLMALRPIILRDTSPLVANLALFAPLIIGGGYGARVAFVGLRRNIGLGRALLRALVPWETGR